MSMNSTIPIVFDGLGWFECKCEVGYGYCEHYRGKSMPYWLCEVHSKGLFSCPDLPHKQRPACEHCLFMELMARVGLV